MERFSVSSSEREQMIDITSEIQQCVAKSSVQEGLCIVFTPHTTAAVTINENADPSVTRDIISGLRKLIPHSWGFSHMEGNSDAHIKSSLVGCSQEILVEGGRLVLGTWQGIYFCEFDGPRHRKVYCKVIAS